jgi:hypothetical protein
MHRQSGRPGWHVPWLFLAIGCGSAHVGSDSGLVSLDAPGPEDDATTEAPVHVMLDARAGLVSGAPCDTATQCLSGACTLGACSEWSDAMRITIDTTSSGANIREAVTGFPLLVRLRASNFTFTKARNDGSDVRFLDASGTTLSHEIERWDAQHGSADLWVLVPRIEADSKDSALHLYWGNPLATPISAGPSVFGDFACVLHMGKDVDGIASHLQDSSGQNNAGLAQETSAVAPPPDGISGPALGLDGKGSYLATSTMKRSPQTFSISLWLKTVGTPRAGIAGFARRQTGSASQFDRAIWMDDSGRLSFGVLHGSNLAMVTSLTPYSDGAWHHVLARLSSSGQYLFVDGESIADDPTGSGADSYDGFWRFGQDPLPSPANTTTDAAVSAGGYFAGVLDEIRISTRELSDAWIRLAYATQRPDTNVVGFQPLP